MFCFPNCKILAVVLIHVPTEKKGLCLFACNHSANLLLKFPLKSSQNAGSIQFITLLSRLIRSGMDSFFNDTDPITNVAEYMTTIRDQSGVSSASLVVSYILLERFVAGVFFDFDELVVFSSKSARRLLLTAIFTASKIYDADSPKGFWNG
jgi:hypothetical protein